MAARGFRHISYEYNSLGVDADGAREITNHYTYDSLGRLKLAISGGMCYTYEYYRNHDYL